MNNQIEKQTIAGIVSNLLLNKTEGFEIILVDVIDANFDLTEKQITMIGMFDGIEINNQYVFNGTIFKNEKYGLVFQVDDFKNYALNTPRKKVDADLSEQLTNSKLTNEKNVESQNKIVKTLYEGEKDFDVFAEQMEKLGVQNSSIVPLYDQYGYQIVDLLKENPFIPLVENRLITFGESDQIANRLNYKLNDDRRIQAAIVSVLERAVKTEGDTYLEKDQIFNSVLQLVDLDDGTLIRQIGLQLDDLVERDLIIADGDRYYFPEYYHAERAIANKINALNHTIVAPNDYQVVSSAKLNQDQTAAVMQTFANNLFLISGEANTGKKTIVAAIFDTYFSLVKSRKLQGKNVVLVSPTKNSAKNVYQATKRLTLTIYDFLQNNPSDVDTLIITDSSMIDVLTFAQILESLSNDTQLILIGSSNQLPSAGAGQVFLDLVNSKKIPTTKLENIYRIDKKSTINKLISDIKEGKLPGDFTKKTNDRSFVKSNVGDIEQVLSKILNVTKKSKIPMDQIQIIASTQGGPAGVENLNSLSQTILNPEEGVYSFFNDQDFKIGDKVMQNINDIARGISQGDQGIIVSIEQGVNDEIDVKFGDQIYKYKNNQIRQISLSYVTTANMIQGNKYQVVILVLLNQFNNSWNRNLILASVESAQNSLFMIGDDKAYLRAVTKDSKARNSLIAELIVGNEIESIFGNHFEIDGDNQNSNNQLTLSDESFELNEELIHSGNFDPMIGMEFLRPEDFDVKDN